ncbi:MAG TPA: RNA polymerase sigma factor RpoD/SigA [Gemmatimonadaceae bacterium]|nr:RNA polymerase sigma factor RpoD/SigA [Gemmatimonadaceae bacterium]
MANGKRRRRRRPVPAEIGPAEADKDILDQYFAEVSRYPLLKRDEERVLARRVQKGDQEATEELVRRNLRFVVSVAKKYQNRGLPLIDLIGEGNVGLMTAAHKFDPDQGVKFISYAVWWIRQAILAALARQGRTVRVPLNRTADLSRVIKATALLREKLDREPTSAELSQLTGISEEIVQALSALNTADVRLDATVGRDSDRAMIERFALEELPNTEAQVIETFRHAELERALQTLPPRDARILRLYFGIDGDREHTLDEIGQVLGVTRERVRQLRDRALKRLREGAVGEVLRDLSAA